MHRTEILKNGDIIGLIFVIIYLNFNFLAKFPFNLSVQYNDR